MVRFGQLVAEQRWINEIDINPLFVSAEQIIALDARVVLYDQSVQMEELPQLAIRPYPTRYVKPFTAKDGSEFTIRPIRPEDEPLIVNYHRTLSEQSVYLRYFRAFQYNQRVEHDRMIRICFVDYDRDMALVTERVNPHTSEREIVAVGRLTKIHGTGDAEFAMLVNDACQGKGIGTELLQRLLEIGRDEQVERVVAYMLAENRGMYHICKNLGFSFQREDELIKAEIDL